MGIHYPEKGIPAAFVERPGPEPELLPPMPDVDRYSIATKVARTMIHRYQLPADDVIFMQSDTVSERRLTVVYAAERGIVLGGPQQESQSSIGWRTASGHAMDGDFQIETGSRFRGTHRIFDARSGMTRESYAELMEECIRLGRPLPDIHDSAGEDERIRTATLLSGHLYPNCRKAYFGFTYRGQMREWHLFDDAKFLFRPAVILRTQREKKL